MVERVGYLEHLDKGPWSVVTTPLPEEGTYLESDDFTHDVRLKISGDFGNIADRERYAFALAEALNAAAKANAGNHIVGAKEEGG